MEPPSDLVPQPQRMTRALPAVSPAIAPTWWDVNNGESGRRLTHYLFIFRRRLGKIASFVIGCTLLTLIVSLRLTPVYESTATIDIDRRMPTGIVGQDSIQPLLNDSDQYLATQVQMIESDSVLRPVALRYQLPEREKGLLDQWLGSGEFDPDAPIELDRLTVRRPPNTYLLKVSYRSEDRQLAADVANAIAQSYLEHSYRIRYQAAKGLSGYMTRQLEELLANMERSSDALARYERELNIINPEERTNILSARLLELNSEFTKAQADRVAKEAAARSIEDGSLDAALTSSQGDSLKQLTEDYNQARQKFAEVKIHFGPNHPEYLLAASHIEEVEALLRKTTGSLGKQIGIEYQRALERERLLGEEVREIKSEFDRLNAGSFEYQARRREADGDKQLYEELLRKINEATINSSFQNSSARIADPARPAQKPVFPRIPINVLLAFLVSAGLACGAAITADYLDNTIRDPEQVAQTMNTQVIGTLPMVKSWRGKLNLQTNRRDGAGGELQLHKNADPTVSSYAEAVRTLRNSILLSDFDHGIRSLLITSASPGEGKSTTAVHLAISHAKQQHRTLLIDGDLRRPSVHKRFGLPAETGLSTVLLRGTNWREALLQPAEHPHLHLLPAGPSSRQAADLVGQSLVQVVAEASMEYDLVILDAPPLLGFAEPLRMATAVDGVIVVMRAGETNRKAVSSVVDTLRRIRANLMGLVLNEVHREVSDGYYYYSYYRKYYSDHTPDREAQDEQES